MDVSSLKLQAGKTFGEEGRARDTRLCFMPGCGPLDGRGKGAVKEKDEEAGKAIFLAKSCCCCDM